MAGRLPVRKLALALLLLVAAAGGVLAQTKPRVTTLGLESPKTVVYIGNSFFYYNNGMPAQVVALSRAADAGNQAQYRSSMVTISGSGLDWHDVDTLFRPNAIGRYSFDQNNNVVFNTIDKLFEVAVMMDCSQCPVHPQLKPLFHEFAKKHSETVAKHGARPVFFMSWAYADKPEMTAQLAEEYTIAGNSNGALVIPAGLAFAKSISRRPDLNLYAVDKRHPSALGTYLAASTIYAALYRKSPVGNAHSAGLDPATVQFLQSVAWETVQEYFYGQEKPEAVTSR